MFVQASGCLKQIFWNLKLMAGILQEASNRRSPTLTPQGQEHPFHGFLSGLMSGEARPVVIPILQGMSGMVQIMEGLSQPVESTVCHSDPPRLSIL